MKEGFLPNKVSSIGIQIIDRKINSTNTNFRLDSDTLVTPVTSIDFIVDGQSLFETLQAKKHDLVGPFSSPMYQHYKKTEKIFLQKKKSDLNNERVLIYCCAECGDIDCGGITAKIVQEGNFMKWFDFAYENNYNDEMTDRQSYQKIGPFYFKLNDYIKVITAATLICKMKP